MASSPTEDIRRSFKRLTVDQSRDGHKTDEFIRDEWRSIPTTSEDEKLKTSPVTKQRKTEQCYTTTRHATRQLDQREQCFTRRAIPYISRPVHSKLSSRCVARSVTRMKSCREECVQPNNVSVNELAAYLDNYLHIPKEMSHMAELMYT
ncbi:uncharacterized protein LOC134183442 [Corticium candelabrum]|uniref:uncharacterized protein LOC134183442 n=1 Tax=Corticium candelabrum TaxID=121492 RepID=UPI002E25B328|nr:uncharacterized protein LOC134183442 [Corticium candelabrum]